MPEHFDQISAPAPKDKQMAGVGIAPERLLHEHGQAVESFAHVRVTRREPHAHTTRNRDHRRTKTAMTRASAAPFTSLSTITRHPPASTISITPRATAPDDEVTASGPAGRPSGPGIRVLAGGQAMPPRRRRHDPWRAITLSHDPELLIQGPPAPRTCRDHLQPRDGRHRRMLSHTPMSRTLSPLSQGGPPRTNTKKE